MLTSLSILSWVVVKIVHPLLFQWFKTIQSFSISIEKVETADILESVTVHFLRTTCKQLMYGK